MQLKDEAILLDIRKLLENKAIITAFSKENGVYSGVCNLSSNKMKHTLQIGNLVDFSWNARLEEHLGRAKCEPIKSYGSIILLQHIKLLALTSIMQLSQFCLHERHPYPQYYNTLLLFVTSLAIHTMSWSEYFKIELALLNVSGYALDLSICPVTGSTEDLYYVSPKTGRSISRAAGGKYHDQLLILPQFLLKEQPSSPTIQEIKEAETLCSYFFERHLYKGKPLPNARTLLFQSINNRGTR